MREIDVAAAFEVYSMSSAARTVAVAPGTTLTTRHGLVLLTMPAATASRTVDRMIAPGSFPTRDGSSYDAALQELAASTNPATARSAAKLIDYPIGHLRLEGGAPSIRTSALLAVSVLLAAAVSQLPRALERPPPSPLRASRPPRIRSTPKSNSLE